MFCPRCEARPGDNPVCIWTLEPHPWAGPIEVELAWP